MSFQLSILTPSGKVYEDTVDSLAAPGLQGGFEIFSNHAAMLIALKEGKIRIRKDAGEQSFTTASGILEVQPDHSVLVLVDTAN